jgi:purine-binding chemotaxis protein CheW
MPDYIEGVMNLRGQITTVIDLKKRFGISNGEGRTAQSRIIVAEIGDNQLGIIVDAVEDVMRISRTSISIPPMTLSTGAEAAALTGMCKLGDKLVMMLDLERIMSEGEKARLGMADPSQTVVNQKEAAEVSK